MVTNSKVANPKITKSSCTSPGTFSLLFSRSRISNTHTYNKVPAARACKVITLVVYITIDHESKNSHFIPSSFVEFKVLT